MFISIAPVPKPRQTRRDKWAQRPAVMRYRYFCDELRLKYNQPLPDILGLIFYIPMPQSWSLKKKARYLGQQHQQKPDTDNLTKAVMDALRKDDSGVYVNHAEKYWSDEPGIEILSIHDVPIIGSKHDPSTRKIPAPF